jgi:PhnB protein
MFAPIPRFLAYSRRASCIGGGGNTGGPKGHRIMQLQPYLFFTGECEEALNFYRSVFGGDIASINRYGGSPMEQHAPPGWGEKIMHATFTSGDITLMAADSSQAPPGANNARARLCVGTADHDQGRLVFDALAAGGTIAMPYEKQFWGASFGMLVDRFGIEWMVNAG